METIQAVGLILMITGAVLGIASNLPPVYDLIKDTITSWLSPTVQKMENEKQKTQNENERN